MLVDSIRYLHITSLAMWFGGLFGYVLIVWPSIVQTHQPKFPRQVLSMIAVRTAPWIYLAMASALTTAIIYVLSSFDDNRLQYKLLYLAVLVLLVANNVYGTLLAWPRIMLSPDNAAIRSWRWFYRRMALSLIGGLMLLSIAIVTT